MRIKPKPLEIGDETGFGENDLFWRKDFADRLTNLVKSIEDPTVFLLDAPWGDGKTTFLKQWAGELRSTRIPVIEFDAFARDYQADPFIALSAEIFAAAQKVESLEKTYTNFVEKAKSLGKSLLPIATQIAISKATLGLLSPEDVKNLGEISTDEGSAVIEERLKAAEADTELLSSFREALEELAKGMSTEEGTPLVLIVDELDRCRPSFAVELIEKIKHVFSVPGVHFVLSAYLPQLTKIFQNTHGLGDDEQALIYLEKFYDVRLRFSASSMLRETLTSRYIPYLWGELNLLPMNTNKLTDFLDSLECVFRNRQVSLRTVEKIMTNIALYYAGASAGGYENVAWVAGVCCIRHCDTQLYEKIASTDVTLDDINRFFGFANWPEEGTSSWFQSDWRLIFGQVDERTAELSRARDISHNKGKANEILPKIAAQIDNFYP